jgi:hypothetical protein
MVVNKPFKSIHNHHYQEDQKRNQSQQQQQQDNRSILRPQASGSVSAFRK